MTKRICSIDDCGRTHFGKGYCQMHAYRARTNGDPLIVRPRTAPGAHRLENHPNWRGDDAEYPAVHARLSRNKGKASSHACIECGSMAKDWAYQHNADNELIDAKRGLPYSTNLDDYAPMCSPCHNRFDALNGWLRDPLIVCNANTSGYRGVSFHKQTGKWRAYATRAGKQHTAGLHKTAEEAALAAEALRRSLLEWAS